MRKARTNASRRISPKWSIQRSASTGAVSSRPPATACWRNSPASSMRCAARLRCSAGCSTASPKCPTSGASGGAWDQSRRRRQCCRAPRSARGARRDLRLRDGARPNTGQAVLRAGRSRRAGSKNIARPVRVYALRPEAVADLPATGLPVTARRRRRTARAIAIATLAVLVATRSAWWLWPATKPAPTPAVTAATSIAQPLTVPRLSIVVLPFANLSSNPEQQYFADAITEDVTTDLSRIAHSFVIKRVDTNQIGRDLGVRYVLEGSVRRSANKVRINTQLIDAETDAHLWAE